VSEIAFCGYKSHLPAEDNPGALRERESRVHLTCSDWAGIVRATGVGLCLLQMFMIVFRREYLKKFF
jgi:hypothetical protein